jgi:glutamine synthetase
VVHNLPTSFFHSLIAELTTKLKQQGINLQMGFEHEFYVRGVHDLCWSNNTNISLERGLGQYELSSPPFTDFQEMLQYHERELATLREAATQKKLSLDFSAKPSSEDYGSSLQLSITLTDQEGNDLYTTKMKHFLYAVGGLVKVAEESVYLLYQSNADYRRFRYYDLMTATTASWGYNNRSTALRITKSGSEPLQRIEFRIAPATADLSALTFVALAGMYYGIEHRIDPGEPIYGNAHDENYANTIKSLPGKALEAKLKFDKGAILKQYMGAK